MPGITASLAPRARRELGMGNRRTREASAAIRWSDGAASMIRPAPQRWGREFAQADFEAQRFSAISFAGRRHRAPAFGRYQITRGAVVGATGASCDGAMKWR
jgi:hypothetical protein